MVISTIPKSKGRKQNRAQIHVQKTQGVNDGCYRKIFWKNLQFNLLVAAKLDFSSINISTLLAIKGFFVSFLNFDWVYSNIVISYCEVNTGCSCMMNYIHLSNKKCSKNNWGNFFILKHHTAKSRKLVRWNRPYLNVTIVWLTVKP